jgi:hypothetical protein
MNHTFDKYDSYLSMKPRFSRDSLARARNPKLNITICRETNYLENL